MKAFPLALLLALAVAVSAIPLAKEEIKQLAGPPSQFGELLQPDPKVGASTSHSAWLPIDLEKVKENGKKIWSWSGQAPVDSESKFTISVFCPQAKHLSIYVQPPGWPMTLLDEKIFNAPGSKIQRVEHDFGVGLTKMPVVSFIFPEPIRGEWKFQIKSHKKINKVEGKPQLYFLLGNESPYKVTTHLNTYDLQQGQEVGLVAQVFDHSSMPPDVVNPLVSSTQFTPLVDVVEVADLNVIFPSGKQVVIHMNDKGVRGDLVANDGAFSAVLEATEPGDYITYSVIKGKTAAGFNFTRTNVHSFKVVGPDVTLTGLSSAVYEMEREDVLVFELNVDTLDREDGHFVRAYAEVWGTDQNGYTYTPVAWIQAMTPVFENEAGKQVVRLELHKNWVQIAKASPPFQLRNADISDPDTGLPYSERPAVYVSMDATHISNLKNDLDYDALPIITQEMQEGPRPARYNRAPQNQITSNDDDDDEASATRRKILLIHGYCAGSNEFPVSQFENSVLFEDLKKSRSNQEFALEIKKFADQYPEGVSVVVHSQGGLASLHLHTYFWSTLEVPVLDGGRLIQSVGSPYQGTTLAGFLADIGWVFGIGCGGNNDLTRDGAANWLSKIPPQFRNDVYYYTTQYEDYWWILPNDCVTAANVVLSRPNDGTTEEFYGQLKHGHNAGHKVSWCHTGNMKYPAQCLDPQRNAEMNRLAARV